MIDSFNDGPSLSYAFSLLTFSLICIFTIDIYQWARFCNVTFTLKQKQETFFISFIHFWDLQTKQSQNIQIVQMSENFFRKKDADKNFRGQ